MLYKTLVTTLPLLGLIGLLNSTMPSSKFAGGKTGPKPATALLTRATLNFVTPAWGDGKNDENSMVDAEIKIYANDGNVYAGFGHFRDPSGIPKNSLREMPIEMSGGLNQLDNSKITSVSIKITYWIDAGIGHSDHWDFRRELILSFADGSVKCSGYNDPAYAIDFENGHLDIPTVTSTQVYDHKTLVEPYN